MEGLSNISQPHRSGHNTLDISTQSDPPLGSIRHSHTQPSTSHGSAGPVDEEELDDPDGLELGELLGEDDGLLEGDDDGDELGELLGLDDGLLLGLELVDDEGLLELGELDGLELGLLLGDEDGELLGDELGLDEGEELGEEDEVEDGSIQQHSILIGNGMIYHSIVPIHHLDQLVVRMGLLDR